MRYFWLVITFLVIGCRYSEPTPPDDLIERDKMIQVLYDLSVFQATINHNSDSEMNKSVPFFLQKKHGIDSLQFVQSNRYYASQIEDYEKMYSKVYEMLKADLQQVESLKE